MLVRELLEFKSKIGDSCHDTYGADAGREKHPRRPAAGIEHERVVQDVAARLPRRGERAAGAGGLTLMPVSTHCRHAGTAGEWLGIGHAVACLGIPRAELDAAVRAGEIRARRIGWGQHVELLRADVEARWPQAFVTATR